MPLAQAQARVPGLAIRPADPSGDARALAELAAWCLRWTPLAAAAQPDGAWLDITGSVHLAGGEAALLQDLIGRLAAQRIAVRVACADTPGAAHAVARSGTDRVAVIAPGATETALAALPVALLRLPPDEVATLHRLGLDRIGALALAPRAPLARRFGPGLLLRLDQAMGRVSEPIQPVTPPELAQHRLDFAEPLLTAEAFATAIQHLTPPVCAALERAGQSARRLDLVFTRVDGALEAIRIGTAGPSRAPAHLARLLAERLETVDPGLGVEAMQLIATLTEPLSFTQPGTMLGRHHAVPPVTHLVDRLSNRLGAARVFRLAPRESDVPERSVRRVPPLAPPTGASWPISLPRPSRMMRPPQPVDALALLPDHPPVAFTWRRVRHRVRRADGPERIRGKWWRSERETWAVRDYFAVEDEQGHRFWLFRAGDGMDPASGPMSWFLHGVF